MRLPLFVSGLLLASTLHFSAYANWFKPQIEYSSDDAVCHVFLSKEKSDLLELVEMKPFRGYSRDEGNYNVEILQAQVPVGSKTLQLVRNLFYTIYGPIKFDRFTIHSSPIDLSQTSESDLPPEISKEMDRLALLSDDVYRLADWRDLSDQQQEKASYASFAGLYRSGKHYLIATSNNNGGYGLFRLLENTNLKRVCQVQLTATDKDVAEQTRKIDSFDEVIATLKDVLGGASHRGTPNYYLRLKSLPENLLSPELPDFDAIGGPLPEDYNLNVLTNWSFGGIWNYRKMTQLKKHVPRLVKSLAHFYQQAYGLNEKQSLWLSQKEISHHISFIFSDAKSLEVDAVYRSVLEGVEAEEIFQMQNIEAYISPLKEESNYSAYYEKEALLNFAIGQPALMKSLIENGADPSRQNGFGKTALMYTAQFDDFDSAKVLLELGADPNQQTHALQIPGYVGLRHVGQSALHYAARYASADFVRLLIEHGAIPSLPDRLGKTALDLIMEDERIEVSRTMTEKEEVISLLQLPARELSEKRAKKLNIKGEKLYRQKDYKGAQKAFLEAYRHNTNSYKSANNLSITELKLGNIKRAAKFATHAISNAESVISLGEGADKRELKSLAAAYYNLGLACEKANEGESYYVELEYQQEKYCEDGFYPFIQAYQTVPTQGRLNKLLSFFRTPKGGKNYQLCLLDDNGQTPSDYQAIYLFPEGGYVLESSVLKTNLDKGEKNYPLSNGQNIRYVGKRGRDGTSIIIDGKVKCETGNI